MPNPIYQTPSSYLGKKAPAPKAPYLTDPGLWAAGEGFSGNPGQIPTMEERYGPGGLNMGYVGPGAAGERIQHTGRMVTPDYSGILGSFTADARARFGAGQSATQAQRLSRARAAVNKLGVRDVPGMLEKLQAYGLSQADLQGAADNPWSELKALEFNKKRAWQQGVAQLAGQGIYRSGATVGVKQDLDREAAMQEAGLTQNTLGELSEGLFGQQEWERQQRDQMEQAIASQQAALASAYQPYWQYD